MAETAESEIVEFRMPSLGSDMESGTVIAWRVGEGDEVSKGDVLLDVDTDKSEIEVEVWRDARVEHILVGPGENVAVGTPIARLAVGTPAASSQSTAGRSSDTTEASDLSPADATDLSRTGAAAARPTPAAPPDRADERTAARPTMPTDGGGGAGALVTPRTVYWPSPVPAVPSRKQPEQDRRRVDGDAASDGRPTRRQNAVALAMEQSNREIPHFHLTTEIDVAPTLAWLESANDERRPPERILTAAIFLRAVALTVRRHPTFNGSWVDGRFVAADRIALGVAVHMRDGTLITPVLPDADQLGLDALMAEFRGLVGRTRSGGLRSSDIAQPTITVTNLGDTGADTVAGLIRPPQVALVGFGRVRRRPVVVDDSVVAHPTVDTTVSADHRANNGQAAAAFLTTLAALVRSPEDL